MARLIAAMRRVLIVLVVVGVVSFTLLAQTPSRSFEVASIRPNSSARRPGGGFSPFAYSPEGRFTATNVTLVDLIVSAYQTRRIQMQGGPDWIDSDRFDIVAKADAAEGTVKREQWSQMLQTLLEDRFKLVLHRESKDMSVYALVLGKNPPNLQPSKDGERTGTVPGPRGQMAFQRMAISGLVNTLSNVLQTSVVDDTGLKGFFNFTLDPMQFATTGRSADNWADLVLEAVQAQLGFKLEKRRALLEITVIDHAERPTEN